MHYTVLIIVVIMTYSCATDKKNGENIEGKGITATYYKGEKVTADEDNCIKNICLNKCCPFGNAYYPHSLNCSTMLEAFVPNVYDVHLKPQKDNAVDLFYFRINVPKCKDDQVMIQMSSFAALIQEEFRLKTDGHLYMNMPLHSPMIVSPDEFCIDNFVSLDIDGNITSQVDAVICVTPDKETNNSLLSSCCMLISCVFILLTVAVYTWLPQLHNIHGRVLVACLLSFFVGFIFMATMQLLNHFGLMSPNSCLVMTLITYFSLLTAFCWLNVMSFDIWRVLSQNRKSKLDKQSSRFRAYAIYAFGVPTLLTILVISLEFSDLPWNIWLPLLRFGNECFLSGFSKLVYLYGPMVILCVANMVLFTLTAISLSRTNKSLSYFDSKDSYRHHRNNEKQRYFLYLKLFIVMGVNWIFEVLSYIYQSTYWCYTDAYNVLIGLIIFIIFVCKPKIFQLLKERYRKFGTTSVSQSNTSYSRTTSSKDENNQ